jgi:hypothetical protein
MSTWEMLTEERISLSGAEHSSRTNGVSRSYSVDLEQIDTWFPKLLGTRSYIERVHRSESP